MPLSIAKQLAGLIRAGTNEGLLSIADGLHEGKIHLNTPTISIKLLPGVNQELAEKTYTTFSQIDHALGGEAVAVALQTAAELRIEEHLERPAVEICWTGPQNDGPLVTPTAAAVEGLLQGCQAGGQILLVSYSFNVATGAFMNTVMDRLSEASQRGAAIRIVLHRDEEERNLAQLQNAWDVFAIKPKIYTWDPPADHPYTKLHAKCLVVDRLQVLITSANFTFHGLESNIELGLLVRNQPLADAVADCFDQLIDSRVLCRWGE